MQIKRLLLFLVMAVITVVSVSAARAFSEPVSVTQPDGTSLLITLYGDEHLSWTAMADGTLVLENDCGYFVASIDEDGMMSATDVLAHSPELRDARELALCLAQKQRRDLFFQRVDRVQEAARRAQVVGTDYFPHTGSPKSLVILVNFKDVQFSSDDPVAQFNQYFNGEVQTDMGHNESKNIVSVQRYFELSSHGQFKPQFDIVGPITLPDSMEYYGADQGSSHDIRFNEFCVNAINAADSLVDYHLYDNNNDGKAELVCIIYAGYGQSVNGNPANTIWPKCSLKNLNTKDQVRVSYCNCSPELFRTDKGTDLNGIGLFNHEFSHGMGLPDLYATNASARVNNQSPEFWDLMDYGEYANNGYAPVPYSVWEQEAMGWIEVEELTESRTGLELRPLIQGGKAYKFGNGANSEEWFMIENAQPRDRVNFIPGFAYGHGLLVWHIAYASNRVNMMDYPNNTAKRPRVSIVPADSLIINGYNFGSGKPYTSDEYLASLGGDPFPGTGAVTTLDSEMLLPNYTYYNGDATPIARLTNIVEDPETGVIIFDFDSGMPSAIRTLESSSTRSGFFTLDGRRLSAQPVRHGLYIHDGRLVRR